jgi:HAD superfamily hydrolase (TIGR01549 family)
LTPVPLSHTLIAVALSALLFDFGDTLLSTRVDWAILQPTMLEGLEAVLKPSFKKLDYDKLKQDFLQARKLGKELAEQNNRETKAIESLQKALSLQGADNVKEVILQRGVSGYFAPEEACYSIIAGVPEMLSKLTAMKLRLGVVSNATCGVLIRRALERRMLLRHFAAVVISAEVGVCKPNPILFRKALEQLNVPPEDAAMVGDQIPTDIEGAHRMKMRSVLVDFLGDGVFLEPAGIQPTTMVRHPLEIVSLAKSWMK